MKLPALKLRLFSRRLVKRDDGGAMIEFALVSPVLILMLMGIVEFGAALFIQSNMVNVARDAARRTATDEFTTVEAEAYALDTLVNWGMTYTVDVQLPDPTDPTDDSVTAVITVPLREAAILNFAGMLDGFTLTASAVMRQE